MSPPGRPIVSRALVATALLDAVLIVGLLLLGQIPAGAQQADDEFSDACAEPLVQEAPWDAMSRTVPEEDCKRLVDALLVSYHEDEIANQIREGRRECVATIPSGISERLSDEEWQCLEEFAGTPMPGSMGLVDSVMQSASQSVFDQLYEWVASGAGWALQAVMDFLQEGSGPEITTGWFVEHFTLMASIAALVTLPLLMVHTIVTVARGDLSGLVRGYLLYVPAAAVGTALAIPLVDQSLAITDVLTDAFASRVGSDMEAFVDGILAGLSPGGAAAAAIAGAFLTLLAAFIAVGALAVWLVLVLRDLGILIALFMLPLGFASLVWARTRPWFGRLVKLLAALILSKFVIVAITSLGAAALSAVTTPEDGGAGMLVTGVGLLSLAALAPVLLLQIADVAGDSLAGSVEGVTQQRTSPVPMPRQTSARALNGMMDRNAEHRSNPGASAGWATAPSSYLTSPPLGTSGKAGGNGESSAVTADRTPSDQQGTTGSARPVAASAAPSGVPGSGAEGARTELPTSSATAELPAPPPADASQRPPSPASTTDHTTRSQRPPTERQRETK